jgi:hypothetical protein
MTTENRPSADIVQEIYSALNEEVFSALDVLEVELMDLNALRSWAIAAGFTNVSERITESIHKIRQAKANLRSCVVTGLRTMQFVSTTSLEALIHKVKS